LLAAAVDAIEEVGYHRVTVAQIVARAGVSRKTFYDTYTDREECFLAALEQTFGQAIAGVERCPEDASWRDGVRAGLARLLATVDDDPALARLWLIEAPRGGDRVLRRRAEVLHGLARRIDAGREQVVVRREPPTMTADALVGGVLGILHSRALRARDESFSSLLGPLMYMIVLPYLGPAAADAELHAVTPIPAPTAKRRRKSNRNARDRPNLRLTYRTARVLATILEVPGASNREVADRSGIRDAGQISKLLGRIAKVGLIENRGSRRVGGTSNAWYLTGRGEDVVRTTHPPERLLA
jgi:AcrR family transcriptional regulator/DNA-binding MarR family transcriptional regulator